MKSNSSDPFSKEAAPSPAALDTISYEKLRDQFLKEAEDVDPLLWLVTVGMFVRDRWLAEESGRQSGSALVEEAQKDVWDRCTEGHVATLRQQADAGLKEVLQERRARAFVVRYFKALALGEQGLRGIGYIRRGAWWLVTRGVEGVVTAVFLVIGALTILWAAPGAVHFAQRLYHDAMPEEPGRPPDANKRLSQTSQPAAPPYVGRSWRYVP